MTADPQTESTADVLEWRVHPARERLPAALFALAVMTLFALLTAALIQNLWWGAAAFVFLLAALRRFFLPRRFRIDGEGVTAVTLWSTRRYRWPEIRRFLCDARGGFLSTHRRNSVMDLFRGMHLVFGQNRNAVIARIRSRIDREAAA